MSVLKNFQFFFIFNKLKDFLSINFLGFFCHIHLKQEVNNSIEAKVGDHQSTTNASGQKQRKLKLEFKLRDPKL